MFNIDVHILKMPRDCERLFEKCLRSLENEPINIHFEQGILGNLGGARINGFGHGTAEFVSYVDPDDMIKPDIFQKMLDAWDDNFCGIYCDQEKIDIDGNFIADGASTGTEFDVEKLKLHPTHVHQIIMYKRKTVDKYKHMMNDYTIFPENILNLTLCIKENKPFKHFNEVGYYWRQIPKDRSHFNFELEREKKRKHLEELLG